MATRGSHCAQNHAAHASTQAAANRRTGSGSRQALFQQSLEVSRFDDGNAQRLGFRQF